MVFIGKAHLDFVSWFFFLYIIDATWGYFLNMLIESRIF